MLKLVAEYHCRDDEGETYVVHILETHTFVTDANGKDHEVPGAKFAVLAGTSNRVNPVDGKFDAFEISGSGKIIKPTKRLDN